MCSVLETERVNIGVAVNSWPIEIGPKDNFNSLEERAFPAKDGPEAAGLVDQIAGAVGVVGAGGCFISRKKSDLLISSVKS